MRYRPLTDAVRPKTSPEFSAMSTLNARRHARKRVSAPAMHSLDTQLAQLKGSLIAKVTQPDSTSNRAELKALALATAFVLDSMSV